MDRLRGIFYLVGMVLFFVCMIFRIYHMDYLYGLLDFGLVYYFSRFISVDIYVFLMGLMCRLTV